MRGDAVGVGLEVRGGAVVGIGIVVTRGDGDDATGAAQEKRRTAMRIRALRRVARRGRLSSVGVF